LVESSRLKLVLLLACGGLLAVVTASAQGAIGILTGSGLVVLVALPLALRLRQDRLDAPGLYAILFAATLGVTSIAWLGTPNDPGPGLDRADVADALLVVAAGLAAFSLGAIFAAGEARELPPPRASIGPPNLALLALAYAGPAVATVVGVVTHTYGYLGTESAFGAASALLPFVASLTGLAILIAGIWWLQTGDRGCSLLVLAMLAVQVPLGFIAGFKGESVVPFVVLGLAAVAYGRAIPWRAVLIGALLVFGLLVPANQAYRKGVRGEDGGVLAGLKRAASPSDYRPDRMVKRPVGYIFDRFRNIDAVALIKRDTGTVYASPHGALYAKLPLIVTVPRQLWEDKPVLDTSGDFATSSWERAPSYRTAEPLTQPGDLFRNFGWAGVAAGLFAWGIVIGVWQRARRRLWSPRMLAIYLWSLPAGVLYIEGDLPNLVATQAKAIPVAALAAWFLLPGRRHPPGYRALASRLPPRRANLHSAA
jgi:hypothetical protein